MNCVLNCLLSEWTILLVGVSVLIYKWLSTFDYWSKRNVPHPKPIPIFGNTKGILFGKESFFEAVVKYCEMFKDRSFFGAYGMRVPSLVIQSPELIKQIAVKDFDYFTNHRNLIGKEADPLFGNSLFLLQDQEWKDVRSILSPAFTGSKMRQMFELVEECSADAITYLNKEAATNKPLVLEMRDFVTHFTNDVIATCAFGLKINSLLDKDNEFYRMGRKATKFGGLISIKMALYLNFTKIMKYFKVSIFGKAFSAYFERIVLDAIEYRTRNNIIRPDMINLLMETRKGNLKHSEENKEEEEGFATVQESSIGLKSHKGGLTDIEMVSQCFIFFVAGFETTSVLMCFCMQELMENPDIQKTLQNEIDEVIKELNGKPLTYEVLQKMKYLDMVVSETLRKWPPLVVLDRVCGKPYDLIDPITQEKLNVPVGQSIWFPCAGIHRNPEYYPDPGKFDPERFNDENKHNIKPFTYMPFGVGPRNCIGSRFALMESKALIFHTLSKFNLEVSSKSTVPVQVGSAGLQITSRNGFWIQLEPRN